MHLSYANLKASDGASALAQLGEFFETQGATWQYIKAAEALGAYQLCYVKVNGETALATPALLTTTRPTSIVIPQFAFASGEYGWALCGPFNLREDGVTACKVLSKIANLSVVLYGVAATPGSVDDAVANPPIQGLTLTASQAVDDTATACIATKKLTVNS